MSQDEAIDLIDQAPSDQSEKPQETVAVSKADRCPVTGKFLPGNKGGGRKKGSKDKLNQQVIGTLERIWASRGDEVIEHLAAEKPEVLAGLVARLIPQSLAAEAIEGEEGKAEGNQEVTVRIVTQTAEALPPREVEGELMPPEDDTHTDSRDNVH